VGDLHDFSLAQDLFFRKLFQKYFISGMIAAHQMQRNLNLQQHSDPSSTQKEEQKSEQKKDSTEESTRDWISAFNTSLLTTLSHRSSTQNCSVDLAKLMQSPEFASLLVAAQHLSDAQNLSMEESTDRLVRVFRDMDAIWNQIVIERGLKALSL
jgi:hypothetical protein